MNIRALIDLTIVLISKLDANINKYNFVSVI